MPLYATTFVSAKNAQMRHQNLDGSNATMISALDVRGSRESSEVPCRRSTWATVWFYVPSPLLECVVLHLEPLIVHTPLVVMSWVVLRCSNEVLSFSAAGSALRSAHASVLSNIHAASPLGALVAIARVCNCNAAHGLHSIHFDQVLLFRTPQIYGSNALCRTTWRLSSNTLGCVKKQISKSWRKHTVIFGG
jgi:hypothetical protein